MKVPSLNLYYALQQMRRCPYEAIKPAFTTPFPEPGRVTHAVSEFVRVTVDVRPLFTGDVSISITVTNYNTRVGRMDYHWSIPMRLSTVIINYLSGVTTYTNETEPNRWLTMLDYIIENSPPFGYEPDRDTSHPRRLTTA